MKQNELSSTNNNSSHSRLVDNAFQRYLASTLKHLHRIERPHPLTEQQLQLIAPSEFTPPATQQYKRGVLLIHGLLDSCCTMFSLKQHFIGKHYWVRNLLLPGHGTHPSDLLSIRWQEWVECAQLAIDDFKDKVDHLTLIGLSTGGCIATLLALNNHVHVDKLILFAPAFRLKHSLSHWLPSFYRLGETFPWLKKQWLVQAKETDPYKYQSIAYNGVAQLIALSSEIGLTLEKGGFPCPTLTIVSLDDETVSAYFTINLLKRLDNPGNQLIIYANDKIYQPCPQNTEVIPSCVPQNKILDFSHVCMHVAPSHPIYGQPSSGRYYFGALTPPNLYNYALRLKRLTYNPKFEALTKRIDEFLGTI